MRPCVLASLALATVLRCAAESPPTVEPGTVKLPEVVVEEHSMPKVLTPEKLATLYRPLSGEQIALAPDGRHVAYTTHEGEELIVYILDLDHTELKQRIVANIDRVPDRSEDTAKTPAQLAKLQWINAQRLIWATSPFEIVAVDADGRNGGTVANKDTLGRDSDVNRSPRLVALPPDDPEHVIVQAIGHPIPMDGRMPMTAYRVDHRTQKHTDVWTELTKNSLPYADRFGQLRILESYGRGGQGSTFSYRPERKGAGWISLEEVMGPELGKTFRRSPESNFAPHSLLLGVGFDPGILYFASNIGRDTFGLYAFDVRKKQRTTLFEDAQFDSTHLDSSISDANFVFDRQRRSLAGVRFDGLERQTRWLDPEIGAVQAQLDAQFPRRHLQILEWDESRARFLVLSESSAEPGRFYLFRRKENSFTEIVRRTGWIDPDDIHPTESFAFTTPGGVRLTGYVTLPQHPRVSPAPLIVLLHDGPAQRESTEFNRSAQAMAEMGFIVLRLNYRGSIGFGRAHFEAIRAGFDRVPLEDVHAAMDWLVTRHPFNRKRVALAGLGFGGYLALRGLQLFPGDFRCAFVINPVADPAFWTNAAIVATPGPSAPAPAPAGSEVRLITSEVHHADDDANGLGHLTEKTPVVASSAVRQPVGAYEAEKRRLLFGDLAALRASSVLVKPETITRPLLILYDEINADLSGQAARLHVALADKKIEHEYHTITDEFMRNLPGAQSDAYSKIEEFLNLHIYDFGVNVGETRVKE